VELAQVPLLVLVNLYIFEDDPY